MQKLCKIDRFAAWVLFISMLIYFISGYGMTKGLINPSFAAKLHTGWLPLIILIAFTLHTSYAIHLAFKRWRMWNTASAVSLVLFFVIFLSFFVYVDRYYHPNTSDEAASTNETSTVAVTNSSAQSEVSVPTATTKTFSLTELAKYNGKNGAAAYVAVDGLIYDVTPVFSGGLHYSHIAGKELTNAFYTRHVKSALSKYPVVGNLE
jgi:predicted heme/steroid binding protein